MDSLQEVKHFKDTLSSLVLGQEGVIEQLLVCVLCHGHVLLTGNPGVAKTTLIKHLASLLKLDFKRLQCTPDLTPYDILGGDTLLPNAENPSERVLGFLPGPIFTPCLLVDEINRASPRTQSALLEAMQEKRVTVGGLTRPLPNPFFVFATQNPMENQGTFPLPEAQLDRFFMEIVVPYPSFEDEMRIATGVFTETGSLPSEMSEYALLALKNTIHQIPMEQEILKSMITLVHNSRPQSSHLAFIKENLDFGVSPRGSQIFVQACKAHAYLCGQKKVEPQNVVAMTLPVFRHRCVLSARAHGQRLSVENVVEILLRETIF